MRVYFAELPEPLRVGGLEKACRELQAALEGQGIEVLDAAEHPPHEPGECLVHFHGLWSTAHARLASRCRHLGIPYVSSPHGMLEPWAWRAKRWKKWPYFRLVERRKLASGACILATAPQEAERLRAFFTPNTRVETLPLGGALEAEPDYANAREQLGWSPHERVLLYLSRIHPKKGLLQLLEALGQLSKEERRGLRLAIVGEGEAAYVEACKAAAAALGQTVLIDWHPATWGQGKWTFLQGADLMCLPTFSENFGLIVLEACQVGTRVLTTVETPWAPLAEAGFGWVVEPGVPACVTALRGFLESPEWTGEDRARQAAWAREHYAWDVIVHQYLDLYREVLRG